MESDSNVIIYQKTPYRESMNRAVKLKRKLKHLVRPLLFASMAVFIFAFWAVMHNWHYSFIFFLVSIFASTSLLFWDCSINAQITTETRIQEQIKSEA